PSRPGPRRAGRLGGRRRGARRDERQRAGRAERVGAANRRPAARDDRSTAMSVIDLHTGPSAAGAGTGGSTPHVRVAIVGTGFAGLGLAIQLKQAGIEDFVLLERAGDVGGTWEAN